MLGGYSYYTALAGQAGGAEGEKLMSFPAVVDLDDIAAGTGGFKIQGQDDGDLPAGRCRRRATSMATASPT